MLLVSTYKILKDKKLIIEYFSGDLSVESYLDFKQKLIQDPDFSVNYHYFIYFKDVNFKITEEDIVKYLNFSNKNLKVNQTRKVALITRTPNQVVISSLYKLASKQPNQRVEIFSTCENAFNWLGIPPIFIDESNFIKELQNI